MRLVEIPKDNGGTRPLGIPTIADRMAQTVVKMVLEPLVEPRFHPDSYGYRPRRSALNAVEMARKRCRHSDWVIDLNIRAFFDSIPHDLVERAVAHHTDLAWGRLYVGRWLRAPVEHADGTLMASRDGTPTSLSCGNSACDQRLAGKSRMGRESHVRFSEGGGVKLPSATRQMPLSVRPFH